MSTIAQHKKALAALEAQEQTPEVVAAIKAQHEWIARRRQRNNDRAKIWRQNNPGKVREYKTTGASKATLRKRIEGKLAVREYYLTQIEAGANPDHYLAKIA